MATLTESDAPQTPPDDEQLVDPRAPRFGQTITSVLLLVGIAFQAPLAIYAVAVVLGATVASGWRIDVYAWLWRGVIRVVGPPAEREPASPHRFARLLGAVGTGLASVLLLAGFPIAGYAIAAAVLAAAGLAATTGLCLGCRMYRQVDAVRRAGLV